jgi:serine protease Do
VSAVGRNSLGINRYENFIQTDAAINRGNSGGALIDAEGRLIGINTAIFSPSGGNAGIGFAVPVNLARSVMERLIKDGKVTRGFLGVNLQPEINADLAEQFKLPDQHGAMVTEVISDSPAAQAGLKSGDVIRAVDDKTISEKAQLQLLISQTPPGTKVELKILRGEEGGKPAEKKLAVTVGTLPTDLESNRGLRAVPEQQPNNGTDALDGVEVGDLDAAARHQLNLPAGVHGALVTNVDADSNSAQAGLQQGDVILEINHQPVRNASVAVDLSEKAQGRRVLLRIWRDGASLFLTVDNVKHK